MNELILNICLSFLSALAGAYGGARAATLWQEKREIELQKKAHESEVINALLLCGHYGEIISKIQNKIKSNGRNLEWYEVNLIKVFMPSNLQHNAAELISTLGKSEYDLVSSVIHAEWVAKSAIEVTEKRDVEYTCLQKYLIEKGTSRMLSQQQVTDIIGEAWAAKLESLTKEMHSSVDAAIEQNRTCFNQLVKLLPNEKKLKAAFERVEPTISL
jgi:Fe-S cluster biosynthesis and repair protein YggX